MKGFKKIFIFVVAILVLAAAYVLAKSSEPLKDFIEDLQWKAETRIADIEEYANPSKTPAPELPAVRADLNGPYNVIRVVDGDTAMIDIDGLETRVRFIGIDTPESVNPDESKNTEEGKKASDFTKELLTGKSVYLEYDIEQQDKYGRTLAYVFMDDGETMVQDLILEAGMATTMTIQPNSKYATHFHEVQVAAREAGAGLWATDFYE